MVLPFAIDLRKHGSMMTEQILLLLLFTALFAMLIWGRWRYDLVAFAALVAAIALGLVPTERAFSGFGHPAVIIIALVLIVSRGLSGSGAIEFIASKVIDASRPLTAHVGIMAGIAAAMSAIMNNVAALALLMPVDIQAAHKARRNPALTLMPLSFASILGGMVTLIGTPPNVVIATFRGEALGEPYTMFDFAPVGLIVATIGIVFIAFAGWRLIPVRHDTPSKMSELEDLGGYIAEARVPANSKAIGSRVRDLYGLGEEHDVNVIGLVRNGKRLPGYARNEAIAEKDVLVLEAAPAAIETFVGAAGLDYIGTESNRRLLGDNLTMREVVAPADARITGRSALDLRLLYRHGVTLLGVSRRGKRFRDRVRRLVIEPGDLLLLLGREEQLDDVIGWLGCLPIAERNVPILQRQQAGLAIGIFAAAILAASLGLLYLPVALSACAICYVGLRIVPISQLYDTIEWPVIVLLGSLIPLGIALEESGTTALIANMIVNLTEGAPAYVVLAILMIVTMTLSDLLNNVATALIAAPIGIDIAEKLAVSPDPFLMAVAVASSCAFLTPIGHKNNTLILGPGGYGFGDYWRMGLPLEILVLVAGLPSILLFWPL